MTLARNIWMLLAKPGARVPAPHHPPHPPQPRTNGRNVFFRSRTIQVRRELYAFSANHPLPPNRSLKSAVTPISQVYQPFAGSPALASSARVGKFFFAFFAAFLCGLRGEKPLAPRLLRGLRFNRGQPGGRSRIGRARSRSPLLSTLPPPERARL